RAVAYDDGANLTRDRAQRRDVVDRADRVRDVRKGDHLRLRPDERREIVDVDATIAREARDGQLRAFLDGELLPGDEVGVVLQSRDDDLVAGAHVDAPPRRGDEVERFGRAAGEDEPIGVLHTHE